MGIFEPYREIGYVTAGVPFTVKREGPKTFVAVSIGRAWQIYDCEKLTLKVAGSQLPKKIRALVCYKDYTFAAYGTNIGVFNRADLIATWSKHEEKINILCSLGHHILSVDIKGHIYVWEFKGSEPSPEPIKHMQLENKFSPSCIVHPDTYLNKVIIGSHEGTLQLWNISTGKKLYDFKGWSSSVCCCVSSPALDVIAVGCLNGEIHIHNVRNDEELFSFNQSIRGAVTSLSFRTDGQPYLASGSSSGVISIWNLEKRSMHSVVKDAHDSAIISLHFFANEPVLMSSAADNSIKMWRFDNNDGEAHLSCFRSGHSAPPLCMRFYSNGKCILSAGQDQAFRAFSIFQDQQSKELSQRHVKKRAKKLGVKEDEIKLKPVIAFDFAEIRERDWCNVLTCHMDTSSAYLWRLQNFVLGEHVLTPSSDVKSPIKACAISACGNFALLGTQNGWIELFNVQSGRSRGSYIDPLESRKCAHNGEVVGVACDATNSTMISAGYSGDIKVWKFKDFARRSTIRIESNIIKIVYHRANGLLATASDDMILRLFDVVAERKVREFKGHLDRITDMTFSQDGKWLLSSSMDGTMRVFDVILAKQIDAMQVGVPITALSLSPVMDLLATTHVDRNGVSLWVNQTIFLGTSSHGTYASGENVRTVSLPPITSKEGSRQSSDVTSNPSTMDNSVLDSRIPNLVTLSLIPRSHWQNLTKLDIIKLRNKPIEPPKKPEKAPFFLPSIPTLSGDILFKSSEDVSEKKMDVYIGNLKPGKQLDLSSHFIRLLNSCGETNNFSAFTDYLKGLPPHLLDMELRMLQIVDDDELLDDRPELKSIALLLDYLIHEISIKNNFEFVQAVLKLFLKIHGETLQRHCNLQEKLKKLLEAQQVIWSRIDSMFQSVRCMVTFLSNSQF